MRLPQSWHEATLPQPRSPPTSTLPHLVDAMTTFLRCALWAGQDVSERSKSKIRRKITERLCTFIHCTPAPTPAKHKTYRLPERTSAREFTFSSIYRQQSLKQLYQPSSDPSAVLFLKGQTAPLTLPWVSHHPRAILVIPHPQTMLRTASVWAPPAGRKMAERRTSFISKRTKIVGSAQGSPPLKLVLCRFTGSAMPCPSMIRVF